MKVYSVEFKRKDVQFFGQEGFKNFWLTTVCLVNTHSSKVAGRCIAKLSKYCWSGSKFEPQAPFGLHMFIDFSYLPTHHFRHSEEHIQKDEHTYVSGRLTGASNWASHEQCDEMAGEP